MSQRWNADVAQIIQNHVDHITETINAGKVEREIFENYLEVLRSHLNSSVTETDAIELLAQHLVTGPVFEALFEDEEFSKYNPVGKSMQTILDVFNDLEVESLSGFYESVREQVASTRNASEMQDLIKELYNDFFAKAIPELKQNLGIVYTPIEIVDFILQSTDWVLRQEFGKSLGSEGVNIIDPFTGTGTFMTRLLQSGLMSPDQIKAKYGRELHANEVVLLAYYIAAINIGSAYYEATGEWREFPGLKLTDTFDMNRNLGV